MHDSLATSLNDVRERLEQKNMIQFRGKVVTTMVTNANGCIRPQRKREAYEMGLSLHHNCRNGSKVKSEGVHSSK